MALPQSYLESLTYELRLEIMYNLPYSDIISLCRTSKIIRETCDDEFFWKNKALHDGYIKNISEFDSSEWSKASDRYLELLSKTDCTYGSEKYVKDWKIVCMERAGKKGDVKLIEYFLSKKGSVNYALSGAAKGGHMNIVKYLIDEK